MLPLLSRTVPGGLEHLRMRAQHSVLACWGTSSRQKAKHEPKPVFTSTRPEAQYIGEPEEGTPKLKPRADTFDGPAL